MSTLGMDIRSADPDQKLIYLAHSSSLVPQVYDTHLASGSSGGLGVLSDVGSIIVCDSESTPQPAHIQLHAAVPGIKPALAYYPPLA